MIERDEWVRVKTLTKEAALRFFGRPKDWPVREVPHSLDESDGRREFEVKAGDRARKLRTSKHRSKDNA